MSPITSSIAYVSRRQLAASLHDDTVPFFCHSSDLSLHAMRVMNAGVSGLFITHFNSQREVSSYTPICITCHFNCGQKGKSKLFRANRITATSFVLVGDWPVSQHIEPLHHHNEISYQWGGISCSPVLPRSSRRQGGLPAGFYCDSVCSFCGA